MELSSDALPVLFGVAALLVAKFLAYSGFLHYLGRRWLVRRNPYGLALARLALGAALGALVWSVMPSDRGSFLGSYFGAIAVGRVLAWALVIGIAFGRNARPHAIAAAVAVGAVLSYLIEIPIALGVVSAMGGFC
jgi:hypothetical protein